MKKQIAVFSLMTLMLCSLVFAGGIGQSIKNNYQSQVPNEIAKMQSHQSNFENKYNFTCKNECNYGLNNQNQVTLQIREQKRFFFWTIIAESNLILNEEGEVTELAHNIWARLFGVPLVI